MSYVRYNVWLKRPKVWTEEKLNWLIKSKDIYDDREDILNAFNEHFGTNINLHYLRIIGNKHKLGLPKAHKIIKTGLEIGWVSLRGFTEKNIGDEIFNGKATFIKTSNESKERYGNYVLKQRYLYEQYHSVKLKTNELIIFLNGDKKDFSKENLYKVSRYICGLMSGNRFLAKNSFKTLSRVKFCEWKQKIKVLGSD
jgi:hypothetical protein